MVCFILWLAWGSTIFFSWEEIATDWTMNSASMISKNIVNSDGVFSDSYTMNSISKE